MFATVFVSVFVATWLHKPAIVRESKLAAIQAALEAIKVDPAIAFHAFQIDNPVVRRGEPLQLTYSYSKRIDCSPPDGSGRYVYMAWSNEVDFDPIFPIKSADHEPSGDGTVHQKLDLRRSNLPAGRYDLQFVSRWMCKGEGNEQVIRSAKYPFEILP